MRLLALALLLVAVPASAQTDADAAVRAVIADLFDGMRAKDTTAIRATLHPEARLMTAAHRDGTRSVEASPLDAFLGAVAGAPVLLDERIEEGYPVMIDDGLAVAWTPYRFYAGDQFSHCGTNAFVLALGDDGWQIVQIMDTRRAECG
ncbi:nuclear transport factor 2 family protein [Rubrivirga sp.]|uniref:nuclear transport factor 2 family protein n=1 Tax=Rubrivirga sp. TaxID=1885344 RepID=UPI003B5185DB